MFPTTETGAVGVVIELDEFGTPPEEEWVA
jgi:hypothetical protein